MSLSSKLSDHVLQMPSILTGINGISGAIMSHSRYGFASSPTINNGLRFSKSITSAISIRKKDGNYKSVIDFLKRVQSDVINKRQLEKLIQSGSFDSVEDNRSKLFSNVPQFVNLFGSSGVKLEQNLLFDEEEISFNDKNLFQQNAPEWSSGEKLNNELEVVGFYLFKNLAKPAALTNLTERSLFFMIPTIRGIL